jgi:pimeloyl-ACP methyl ester carboxylesterase
MKTYVFASTCLLILFFTFVSTAQELISYEKVRTYTRAELSIGLPFGARYGVDLYNVIYTTKKLNLEPDTASGVIAVALDPNAAFPFAVYDHGTVDNRDDVPSKGSGEEFAAVIVASNGYLCVAPDYIGLGVSQGIHPYIHPESQAWAGIDLIHASKQMAELEGFHYNEQVFVTGYSQGGHAAMATAMIMERNKELGLDTLTLTAAAPMSGPYSVSNVMKSLTLGDREYFFCGYLGSVFLTVIYAYPDLFEGSTVEDYFKPEYSALIRLFESEEIGLFEMNGGMIDLLRQGGGKVLPKRMFFDDVLDAILNDPSHEVNIALERMDVCDWIPKAPVSMLYCTADEQVSFRNAVYTDSLMNANGAANVSSRDVLPFGNHNQCAFPASLAAIAFMNSYQRIDNLSSTIDHETGLMVWPNPASDHINIIVDSAEISEMILIDAFGNKIKQLSLTHNPISASVDMTGIPSGFYYLIVKSEDGKMVRKKLVVTK